MLRPLAWYPIQHARESGRAPGCKLCTALKVRLRKERYQRELESQDPITEKRCSGCGNMLPAASFHTDALQKDNYQCQCKACRNRQKAAIYLERADRSRNQTLVIADESGRVCFKCSIHKPRTEFLRNLTSICGIRSVCKQCRGDIGRGQD